MRFDEVLAKQHPISRQPKSAHRRIVIFSLWALFVVLSILATAQPCGSTHTWRHLGVWVLPQSSETSITKQLDDVVAAGFTDGFIKIFYHGFTIYPSRKAPQRPELNGKDLLAVYVRETRRRGLRLHASLATFYWEVDTSHYPHLPRTPLFDKHQQWKLLLRYRSQTWKTEQAHSFANPAHPEVRRFVADLVEEVVSRYSVAGVNLDFIRYPDGPEDAGYDAFTRKLYAKRFGIDPITIDRITTSAQWRRWVWFREEQVLETVRLVRDHLHSAPRNVLLSVDVFPAPKTDRYTSPPFQNWREMLARGDVDVLIPMAYGTCLEGIEKELRTVLDALRPERAVAVWPALAIQKRTTDRYGASGHPPIAHQAVILKALGIEGFSVFCYDWILDSEEGLALLQPLGVSPRKRSSLSGSTQRDAAT